MSTVDEWGLAELVKIIDGDEAGDDDLLVRLVDTIADLTPSRPPSADLPVLMRQALRVLEGGSQVPEEVTVPGPAAGWPTESQWRRSDVKATPQPDGTMRLRCREWKPAWLPGGEEQSIEDALYDAPNLARKRPPTPGDPCVGEAMGFGEPHTYTGPAHKQAVRAALAAPEGSTLAVLLPTGAGKSTVALAPAFLTPGNSLSVVVVPTISLALDLERKVFDILRNRDEPAPIDRRFAYVSDVAKENLAEMRRAIRTGEQSIIFTSPESLMGSLTAALYDSASAGRLRNFVIDEAHLVAEWGAEFRPEYQAMAALRRDLLRVTEESGKPLFRTVLMSATLNEESLRALADLYGEPGPFQVVSGMILRPEPAYWVRECSDDAERGRLLLEAIDHLPRPLIVYATRPIHAREWAESLRRAGHKRVSTVTGNTRADQRDAVMNALRDGTLDVVVGTSAFGLGVDNHHVRSIVHVCVPETIDRWYQEVGRGGRDGQPSIALLLWTEEDCATAESLNRKRFIGEEKGTERYDAMLREAASLGDGRFRFDLSGWVPRLGGGGDENLRWNIRTLTLLTRAGILTIETERPPRPDAAADRAAVDRLFEEHRHRLVVQLEHPLDPDGALWKRMVEPRRQEGKRASVEGLQRMMSALESGTPLCSTFLQAYTIGADQTVAGLEQGIRPILTCSGCPAHRKQGHRPGVPVKASPPAVTGAALNASVLSMFEERDVLLVSYDPDTTTSRRLEELVRFLAERGVRLVAGPAEVIERPAISRLHRLLRERYFFTETIAPGADGDVDLYRLPVVPAVFILTGRAPVLPLDWAREGTGPRPRFVVIPADTRDPQRNDRLALEISSLPASTVNFLLEQL